MADFYTPAQRQLQDEFDTRGLADRLVEAIITDELTAQQTAFIHSRNMFFLSTIDERGFPSASYKGGAPGFVRVPDTRSLVFPSYDGNGMFMSLGNIEAKTKVGLQPVEQSPYVPAADGSVQLALWKRIDMVQDVLSETDRAEARSIGLIDIAEYEARVARGELV